MQQRSLQQVRVSVSLIFLMPGGHVPTSAPFVTWHFAERPSKVKRVQGQWMTAIRHLACI